MVRFLFFCILVMGRTDWACPGWRVWRRRRPSRSWYDGSARWRSTGRIWRSRRAWWVVMTSVN